MLSQTVKFSPSIQAFLKKMKNWPVIHKAMLQGSSLMVAEARRQITTKGHIITGNLRRGIVVETIGMAKVKVGSPAAYAYYVEILPDGGYLRPAAKKTIEDIAEYVAKSVADA